jgi:ABC-2 type transport system ATP-binding protein
MTPALAFHDVHRHFDREPVLSGLSFSVQPGEVFALLGRNGAGKTTALRILLGFLAPHAGEARALDMPSHELSGEQRARIGYVSEEHRLYPEMRVREAIRFDAATRARFDEERALDEARRCGLPLDKRVLRLSRGMRAQLALILAVAGEPDLLVFDDPGLGLDIAKRRELLETMIDLLSDRGTAVLFSTHAMSDVKRVADRVGILHEGALVVDAPLSELETRVTRRSVLGLETLPNGLASDPHVLRSAPRRQGLELTLLDEDPTLVRALSEHGGQLGEPIRPDLEDLFLDLTTESPAKETS